MLSHGNIIKLLAEKDILVVEEDNKLYVDDRKDKSIPLENHYGISIEHGKWSYFLYKLEKRNTAEIEVLKQFENKEIAENYLFFKELNNYFLFEIVIPNRNYDIDNWTIETVKEDMARLKIPQSYFSYVNKINSNSIYFFEEHGFWYQGYINNDRKLIFKTEPGTSDSEWLLSLYANEVYVLYLVDLYEKELLERKIISDPFTDTEKLIVLDYK
ncbi:hypothetical protein ATZ33_13765 [Enterococcus silesiacus]|uniref:Uncharacterized protein n=1 Tax=Enterococcus silesiacus TaxID=332949 RepID=A0A0S3KDT7_9ENTE|nr:hypothetical protein [Enterococcus silesiacus]ALS02414.1 hypothetical protein ATZ33_13765 [Enterococcus silesiacus]OJG88189.1 hypothetical protein RV15_GL001848 [Enterococcus silesiacus]